jgi:periplasmic copper chaperone A
MTIANKSNTGDLLKSARTPRAKSVELHQSTMTADGVMQMRKVEGAIPIEAGESLVLQPGGTHLMLLGIEDALKAGEQLILTLEFANAGSVDVVVPVSANAPATTSANP